MNLEKPVNCFIFSRTLGPVRPARPASARTCLGLCLALALVSCTTLEPRNPPATASAVSPVPARPASQSAAVIPVLETASSAEQQALIDAINRDGQWREATIGRCVALILDP